MLQYRYLKLSVTSLNRLASYRLLSSEGCCQIQRQKAASLADERPDLDFDYLLDPDNMQEIEQNVKNRKGVGNIRRIHELWNSIESFKHEGDQSSQNFSMNAYKDLWRELYDEALLIPNKSDPEAPIGDESHARIVSENPGPYSMTDKPKTAEDIVKGWRAISYPRRSAGGRSYALIGPTANLQTALFSFAKDIVLQKGFEEIEVSDILPKKVTQGCGVNTRTDVAHAIQYEVTDFPKMCLSGTAEMGIADKLAHQTFKESELPKLYLAESRCFRPEISKSASEAKLYRVHEFNKLEMFAVCTPTQSSKVLQMFLEIQIEIWSKLGVKFRVLDMPSEELGAPASRKYDIEAWMPGREIYGEVSSTSNCTDYQARRLGIKYQEDNSGEECFVHTCNGTAMASTRALITVLETFQTPRGFSPLEILKKYLPNDRHRDKLKMAPA